MRARRLAIAAGIGAVSVAALTLLRGRRNGLPGTRRLRLERGLAAVRLAARGGARYATSAPRLFASAGEHRQALRNDLALQTAEDVAATLGTMKGVLMKLGQMASYVDDGLSPAARRTLSRLQDSVPPMSPELAAQVITEELGQPPDRAFATWDPEPIAAASIGQVHRAITRDGRAVAVKVQYPGIAETIEADLGNVALLRRMLKITAPMQDVDALLAELRERVTEELDYRREARNQQMFARYYAGHPTIGVPGIVPELSTRRVVTSDLADGARFADLRHLVTGRARPGRRDDLPLRVPQPVRGAGVQRRPAPGELPVPPRRAGHLPGLRAGQVLHRRRTPAAGRDGQAPVRGQRPGGLPPRHGGRGLPDARRTAAHGHDRRAHGGVLRHGPRARPADHDRGLRLGRDQALLRLPQPARRLRADTQVVRDPAADQPGPVRAPRRAVRDRGLALHRRGDLALRPGAAVHPDGRRRGRVARWKIIARSG